MSESPRKEEDEDFHPLNVIQPEKWNNIPICIVDAFRVVISETKANDLKIKFIQDKLLETQKRVDKQIKNVEKMMTTVENTINENINQFKDATKKTHNSINFEIGLISERSNDNHHSTNLLQRKLEELDKNVYNNYKLKSESNEEMKKITTEVTVQIDVSQSYLKEMVNQKFHELSEIPGLAGQGKKFPDIRALVRELHDNYEAKANFLDEIAENRDDYFKKICGRVVDEMNLPQKLKIGIRNELKPEILKETAAKVEERLEIVKEEMNFMVIKSLNELKGNFEKNSVSLDERIKALDQKSNQSISKLESGIRYVSSETDKKLAALQLKLKQIFDDMSAKGFVPDKNILAGINEGNKRASILYQGPPNTANLMRFNESPPVQNQGDNFRPATNENKRQSQDENQIQRGIQEKSVSGSVYNQVSGTSTIEEQPGSRVLQNDNSGVGNSNLIFNQAENRPMSRNLRDNSLRGSSEENRPNSRQKPLEGTDSGYTRPISRSQRPQIDEESRPISRSQKGTTHYEPGDESRPVSGSQKHSLMESPDGTTSIEDVQEASIHQKERDNLDSPSMIKSNYAEDMGMYQSEQQHLQEMNDRADYNSYEPEQQYGNYYNDQGGYPGSASSKHSFLMGPIKANVETQTGQENMLAILSNFDITKMEPYTLEFLRVLEGELSTMRFGIKEVKDELNLHLNYHYYLEKNGENDKKTQRDISPQTFDNILSELKPEGNEPKKSRPRTTGINPSRVKLSPMLMLKMISRRKELENKMKQINELSMDNRANPEPMISIKSHSLDFKLNKFLDNSMINNPYGNNTIRETKEYLENDERDHAGFTSQNSPGNRGNRRNRAEDTTDLTGLDGEKKIIGETSVFLPSILKKPLNTKMAEIGFDPKSKEEILQQKLFNETMSSMQSKNQRPKPPEKKQVSQTEWKKRVESVL